MIRDLETARKMAQQCCRDTLEPYVTIEWTEKTDGFPDIEDCDIMSLSEADKKLKSLDNQATAQKGYYKTKLHIDFIIDGETESYENCRYDIGSEGVGLVEHINNFWTYHKENRDAYAGTDEAEYADIVEMADKFAPYLKEHLQLSELLDRAKTALEEETNGEPDPRISVSEYNDVVDYVRDCRTKLNGISKEKYAEGTYGWDVFNGTEEQKQEALRALTPEARAEILEELENGSNLISPKEQHIEKTAAVQSLEAEIESEKSVAKSEVSEQLSVKDKVNNIRNEMAQTIISYIEQNPTGWSAGWNNLVGGAPSNGKTGKAYRGFNALYLAFTAMQLGYADPRWVTYNQAQELGAQVKRGEKSVPVIFFELYDRTTKKAYDSATVKDMTDEEKETYLKENVYAVMKSSRVFNASQCRNFPELDLESLKMSEEEKAKQNAIIEGIIANSDAPVLYDGGNRAYYSPGEDKVHLPVIEAFNSMQDYYATALHEIAHSTGHESRLNRFGTANDIDSYAKEELRAELACVFLQIEQGVKLEGKHIENHAAYLNSWLKDVKSDPQAFYSAVRDAEKITDYIESNYMAATAHTTVAENESTKEKAAVNETTAELSVFNRELPFAAQVDAVLSGADTTNTHIQVMPNTPFILRQVGMSNHPILMTSKHLKSIVQDSGMESMNYHGLDVEIVKQLPELLSDPVMIMDSLTRDDSIVVLTEMQDKQNRPVIGAIEFDGKAYKNGNRIEANILLSVYGRNNFNAFLESNLEQGTILYWNKEKSQELFNVPGIQFPDKIESLDSDIIIRKAKAFVNTSAQNSLENSADFLQAEEQKLETERKTLRKVRMEANIKEWYLSAYPTDELGQQIKSNISFTQLNEAITTGKDLYGTIGVGDSVVRERLFEHLAELSETTYSEIYNRWLTPQSRIDADVSTESVSTLNVSTDYDKYNGTTSPMIQEYLKAQKENPMCIIAYRLGDFYEVFGKNAETLSKELNLTLTGRDADGLSERIPMIGFPNHASESFFDKIAENHNLAILEDGAVKYWNLSEAQREKVNDNTEQTSNGEAENKSSTHVIKLKLTPEESEVFRDFLNSFQDDVNAEKQIYDFGLNRPQSIDFWHGLSLLGEVKQNNLGYAAIESLTYTGERYSSELGYNMQAAENYYRFSVGTSIQADSMQRVNGTNTITSDKATVSLVMERKDTGLNKGYALFTAMFYRLEQYDYESDQWKANSWNYWFCASVHKNSANGSHIFDGWSELDEMRNRGQYPEGTVYEVSGEDRIDLRNSKGQSVLCKDLCYSPSYKSRLTAAASVENTEHSFIISTDGRYRIAITAIGWRWEMGEGSGRRWNIDGDKKITSNEFIIDHSAPTGTLSGVVNGGYTNADVNFIWSGNGSANTTAMLDGKTYVSGTNISSEGTHTIILKDVVKTTTYTFVIDKTPPKGTLNGVVENGYTNKNVSFEWNKAVANEAPVSATIRCNYGTWEEYISGTVISEEGFYIISLEDLAGNYTNYYFTIDKTPPQGILTGVENGGYTNKDVNFTWTESGVTATLNNDNYYYGKIISEEGTYELVLTDSADNKTIYTFTIDKTAPLGTLSTSQSGGFRTDNNTNGNVTFVWTDKEASASLNGVDYTSDTKVAAEGNYTILLEDFAGNVTEYAFVIDKTAPVGTFSGVNGKGYAKTNVTFTWLEDASKVTAKLNGSNYPKGNTIINEGKYEIILTDIAENSTVYSFIIDKTAPTGTLYGVVNGGYTNGDVWFEWNDSEASATLNGNEYISGRTVGSESGYRLVLTDLAENSTVYTFIIDKTAPTGTLYGVVNGGYTNGNVRFKWTDAEAYATLNDSPYASGNAISDERIYSIVLTDRAKNQTIYTFTIDKTAPTINTGLTEGEHTSSDINVFIFDTYTVYGFYGLTDDANYVTAETSFQTGTKFSIEGNYTIKAVDAAGNVSEKHFTLDKSAPVIDEYKTYTNVKFTLTAQDKYGSVGAWEYRLNQGDNVRVEKQELSLGGGQESNGIWQIRVIDELGNTSSWHTVNFVFRQTFGNSDNIYNSFFVPSYYNVILSQKNYPGCFGTYTFADYSSALNYAVSKEWECRVIVLDGGNSWNYVNISNESTRQIYTDRQELDAVIDKYARKNVGGRKIIGQNGSVINNPTDADGVTREDALTHQITELPDLLSAYSSYRYMLSLPSYSFTTPSSVVEGNKSTATIQFISDGISLRLGSEVSFDYGSNIYDIFASGSEQGWYLVTERDVCGNVEKYLIYLDLEQPMLYADVTHGNQDKERIYFSQAFIDSNAEAMRYIEFDISSLTDNIDDFAMLSIEGRNANDRYVWGDDIPVLNYENGYYGAYKITAYDRSRNILEFTVYIAGAEPSLRHSSVTNDISCTFTIQINDSYNEITDVKFYKVFFDGTEDRLYADSYNTPVSAENLTYKVNIGGKYVFEFTDLYGRTVRTSPIFYMKGLPSAALRGVKDGGLTKNDVGITYDKDVTLELYKLSDDGEWFVFERYEITQGVSSNTANITASRETTGAYKVLLYKTDDRNLFTEYTFEIDGIPPVVQILTDSGAGIIPETVTTESFFVTWQESGYKAYYKKQNALSDSQYSKDTLIIKPGTYVFTIYDTAKNELIFSVTLDNSVSYTLDGSYTLLEDGSYITRKSFTFTVNEPYSEFNVATSNGISVVNGQKLDIDGTYTISVTDLYGNSVNLTLIVDKLPPIPVMVTEDGESLSSGVRTQKSLRVFCEEENVAITYAFGNNSFVAYDGSIIENVGTYTFRLSDRVGNVAEITATIDRELSYRIDGNYKLFDEVYYSRTYFLVAPEEAVSEFIITSENGAAIDTTKKISEEGIYTVKITDIAGNFVVLTFIIDKTAPDVNVIAKSDKPISGSKVINEAFKITCDEADASLVYSFNGSKNSPYSGEWLEEPGIYTYTATDRLGNSVTDIITIDVEVLYSIEGKYTIFDGEYYSNSWLLITPKEDVSLFNIVSENGSFADADKRISNEGRYTVSIIDIAGNSISFVVVIDKTAPDVKVITESGRELTGGAINEAFRAVCDESGAIIEISVNKGNYAPYDGGVLSDEGLYTFRITDRIGNFTELSVQVNYNVTYEVEGAQIFRNGIYYSSAWLLVTPQKDIAGITIFDSNGKQYDVSKRLTEEGEYFAKITDNAGNQIELILVIDKTAPKINVLTESGIELENGTTTNEKFKLVCAEQDAKITYSFKKADVAEYTGEWFTEQGKYTVTAVDFLGNKVELNFSIDTEVTLTFSGTYVVDEYGKLVSKSWILVAAGEELKSFYILASDGNEIDVGSKLSVEGEYKIYAEDIYGNKREIKVVIDKTAPKIQLDGVSENSATNTEVTVSCDGYSELYYSVNGGNKLTLTENMQFDAEGRYLITARDLVGNTSTATFTIDKHVDVVSSVNLSDGCIITGAVSFKFNEDVQATLVCDDEEMIYERGELSKQGSYVLTVTDTCQNVRTFYFMILPSRAQKYCFPVSEDFRIVMEQDGQPMPVKKEDGNISLTETGKYVLRFYTDTTSWTLSIEVDNVAPEVVLENTKKSVTISSPNKDGMTYTLYRNGEKVSFKMSDSADITQKGNYRLVCEDDVGNITEYTFTIDYLSGAAIALIVIISALIFAGILTVILLRLKRRIS